MWKITEEKGLTDKAFELEKSVKRKVGSGRVSGKSVEVLDLETNETKYFPSLFEASKYFGKTENYFTCNNGRVWENKKITIIHHELVISTRILSHSRDREFFVDVDNKWMI